MHPMYSMVYSANLSLCDYVLFLQIRSHFMTQCIVKDGSSKQKGKAAKSRKGVKRPLDSTERMLLWIMKH